MTIVEKLKWFPNTKATAPMTSDVGKLNNLKFYFGSNGVMARNSEILSITHIGDAIIAIDRCSLYLKNMLVVFNIKRT